MELLDTVKIEYGYFNVKCFFQCPVCKAIKIDFYTPEAPDSVMCEKCNKRLNEFEKIE